MKHDMNHVVLVRSIDHCVIQQYIYIYILLNYTMYIYIYNQLLITSTILMCSINMVSVCNRRIFTFVFCAELN